jgi:O-antigen ligase
MMLYLAGIGYALVYFAICWKRPQVAMMLVFALAPFQNDIGALGHAPDPNDPTGDTGGGGGGGPHFSMAEINLMLAAILFVLRKRPLLFGPALVPTLLYFGVCTLSSLLSWRDTTMTSMVQMFLYIVVAVCVFTSLGRDEHDYQWSFYGLIAVGSVLSVAVLVTHSGYVLNLHKNGVGSSLSCAVIVATELWLAAATPRRRLVFGWLLLLLTAGLFFCLSRGGWVGALVGIVLILAMRREFRTLVKVTVAFVPLICICWYLLPEKSRDYTTGLSAKNENIQMRYNSVAFARERFDSNPYLGVGVGLRKEYDATNLLWLILAETGVPGALTFLGLQFAIVRMVWKTQARLNRSDPLYSAVAIGGALILGRLIHGMVDHYWSRGAITIAWAGVGMSTYGYLIVRQRDARARAERRAALFVPVPEFG